METRESKFIECLELLCKRFGESNLNMHHLEILARNGSVPDKIITLPQKPFEEIGETIIDGMDIIILQVQPKVMIGKDFVSLISQQFDFFVTTDSFLKEANTYVLENLLQKTQKHTTGNQVSGYFKTYMYCRDDRNDKLYFSRFNHGKKRTGNNMTGFTKYYYDTRFPNFVSSGEIILVKKKEL